MEILENKNHQRVKVLADRLYFTLWWFCVLTVYTAPNWNYFVLFFIAFVCL